MTDTARDPRGDGLTVGRAAAAVGVSVKTLHHWDDIGLVRPAGRTAAGYRVYDADDLARLHRVLVYRELGFPLARIADLVDDPSVDEGEHLRRQRSELVARIERLTAMVDAVDRMAAATARGVRLTPREQIEIFGDRWNPEWESEARRRWGDTPQWAQYVERASAREADDWARIADDAVSLDAALADAARRGVDPASARGIALAERHRAQLSAHFDCTYAMHVCLGRGFADPDSEYHDHYARLDDALPGWLRAAIDANARAHGVDPETARWG